MVESGILLLSGDGEVAFSSGCASDPRIQALAKDRSWSAEARRQRQFVLEIDRRRLAGIMVGARGADLFVFQEAPDPVFEFVATVDFAYDIMNYLLSDPFSAMTVVDAQSRIAYISPVHEKFFGLNRGEASGRPVREVIENTRLDQVVRSGKAEIGALQKMKGCERVVSRTPILRDGRIVGAVGRVMFKGPEQLEALSRRVNTLEREVEFYRREAASLGRASREARVIVGDGPAMAAMRAQIEKVAPLDMPVLITGESGTGKELVAHEIYRLSNRRDGPFVPVNAAALPASLVESELFGYEAGAFTGADRKGRKGKFEQAHKGTIFLDEIGDMPKEVQAKLLRVLQDRKVERIGGSARDLDFRLISATNHDLARLVGEGAFRLDLFYRISPITIAVPSLADRLEDIPTLVTYFLREVAERHSRPVPRVDRAVLPFLAGRSWPGNVRQLRHAVERAFVFAEGRITPENFADDGLSHTAEPARPLPAYEAAEPDYGKGPMRDRIEDVESELILAALRRLGGNKKRAAHELGISRSYLYKRLKQLGH